MPGHRYSDSPGLLGVNCLWCKRPFLAYRSQLARGRHKFCGNACRLAAQRDYVAKLASLSDQREVKPYRCAA